MRDAFVSPGHSGLVDALPEGAVVGTSSACGGGRSCSRRGGRTWQVVEFRGNVQTRLRKLEDGVAACTFLAMAGLNRLGRTDVPATAIPADTMLPAVAQGAIGIERRADDARCADLLAAIHHGPTGQRLAAERAFLATLDGSCETPIAGLAELDGDSLRLRGQILRPDGSEALSSDATGPIATGADMGRAMAESLLAQAGPDFFDWRA